MKPKFLCLLQTVLSTTFVSTSLVLAHPVHEGGHHSHNGDSHEHEHDWAQEEQVELGTVTLDLPRGLPGHMSVGFLLNGKEVTLRLEKNQVIDENTRFFSMDDSGEMTQLPPVENRSYIGSADDYGASDVSAVLASNGLYATISQMDGLALMIEPAELREGNRLHVIRLASEIVESETGEVVTPELEVDGVQVSKSKKGKLPGGSEVLLAQGAQPGLKADSSSTATLPPTRVMSVLEFEVGVEISSRAFLNNYGGDLALAQSVAQGLPGNLDSRYLRAAGVKHRLGTVIIRQSTASDPLASQITSGTSSPGLAAFRDYWNGNPGEVGSSHDLAVYHVRSAPSGVAYVNSVGTSNRYALSASNGATSWADGTVTHEFGHSWNLRHRADPPITDYDYNAGGTPPDRFYESKPRNNSGSGSAGGSHTFVSIMDGRGEHNIGRLSTEEAATVFQTRQNRSSSGDLVTNPGEIPPFGHYDVVNLQPDSPTTIDVIANDYDSNNDVLDLKLLDTVSQRGGTISLSAGTGPGGRNELTYSPPSGFSGVDFFHYRVCDDTGRSDWGAVYINILGPSLIDTNRTAYFYDIGTASSPLFNGNLDPYERISDLTFGDIGFTSNGPNAVEVRDRGNINGANDLNRDHVRMRSPGTFIHKLANGFYDISFTIGDAAENTAPIRLTAEGSNTLTTDARAIASFGVYTLQNVQVSDGQLDVAIENLGFSANISRMRIFRSSIPVDPGATSYTYDCGPPGSPVAAGAISLQSNFTTVSDVYWSGGGISGGNRGPGSANAFNSDYITGGGVTTLNHVITNGTWRVVLNMGDSEIARQDMQVRAEGQLITDNIDSPAGQFSYVNGSGGSNSPTSFDVIVSDGQLNLEFSDNGGADPNWVVNRIVLTQLNTNVNDDLDGDTYSNSLEEAAGTDPDDSTSRPALSVSTLAGHWPLDETGGGTATDVSGAGQNAVWAGNADENTWVSGRIGGAVRINDEDGGSGNEHFRINSLSGVNGSSRLTLSLWLNQNVAANNNSEYNGLLMTRDMRTSGGSGSGENWGIALENNSSPRHIDWRFNGGPGPEVNNIEGQSVDVWTHVLYVWDGVAGTAQLYQNGQLVNAVSAPVRSIITGGEWRIGDDSCCNGREFTGTLDDVAVFDAALNANDAKLIYDAGEGGFSVNRLLAPPATLPELATGSASAITTSTAIVAYSVTNDGDEIPAVSLYYGLGNGGTTPGNWDSVVSLGEQGEGMHSRSLTGLSAGTTYFYNVSGQNSAGTSWGVTQSFTTEAAGYSVWAVANAVVGLETDDDDGDGIDNLIEYALGLNPQQPDGAAVVMSGNTLTFTKGAQAVANGDVTYRIETSPDLKNPWTPVTATTDTNQEISYMLPAGNSKMFARLRVVRN